MTMHRRSVLPRLAALLLVVNLGCQRSEPVVAPAVGPESVDGGGGTVTIEIDGEQGLRTVKIEGVREGETLESVMRRIEQIPITIHGSGPTAFVDQIGERATSSSAGWTFQVDGEFAMRGIGQIELSPPTTVRWSFGSMPEESSQL